MLVAAVAAAPSVATTSGSSSAAANVKKSALGRRNHTLSNKSFFTTDEELIDSTLKYGDFIRLVRAIPGTPPDLSRLCHKSLVAAAPTSIENLLMK